MVTPASPLSDGRAGAYLDHAASTPLRPEALAAMQPYLVDVCANPSGSHAAARAAKTALEEARETVAAVLGVEPREIVFTGGGSEGDNLAIKGAARAARDDDVRLDGVVTTGIEHKAVLASCGRLARQGFRVETVPADESGAVDLDALRDLLDERTAVVSVMLVNNETGTVQPFAEVAALVRERSPRAVLHTDAVQAPQWLDVGAAARDADLVALSGHKFGGPKGVGVLVVRQGVALVPLIEGGGHEWGLRAGTQNVAGIVALAAALRVTHEQRAAETVRLGALRDGLEAALLEALPGVEVNGDERRRVAGILNVAFEGVESEALLVALDQQGVYAGSGSACSSGAVDPSHVLLAMGLSRERALASVRFSLGWASTAGDVDRARHAARETVPRLRAAGVAR